MSGCFPCPPEEFMSLPFLCPSRAESGKTGCFSPKISRKEMVRRSLRLKFGLGKSNREMVSTQSSPKFGALLFRSRKDVFCNGGVSVLIKPACCQVQEA